MADEPHEVLSELVRLMSNLEDPKALSNEQLVQAVLDARETKKRAEGVAAAELKRRGWTWARIGKAVGVDPSTAFAWAQPYLREDER